MLVAFSTTEAHGKGDDMLSEISVNIEEMIQI